MSGNSDSLNTRLMSGTDMRLRNKYRKPTTLHCSAGNRCSLPVAVCGLVVCLLLLQLYSLLPQEEEFVLDTHVRSTRYIRELEAVDEDKIQLPPPRKRSPRAVKRKPKKPATIIEEFLDESSQIRHVFFPDMKTAIDPNKENDRFYYYPGRIWLDTEGNPIQAHGGGILYDEKSKTYYWYGEYKDGPTYLAHKHGAARVDIIGVGCYSSKDLWTWKNEGIVLAAEENDETHDLHKSNVLERPKVLYNEKTGKYVMWMHIDDLNYTKAHVGVAVSDYPNGPFDYLYSKNPHGFDSRDMTVFRDDDGVAYLIYSSVENSELHVSPLTPDYLYVTSVVRPILIGHRREAPAVFKHQGIYYMVTSGCSGWAPNEVTEELCKHYNKDFGIECRVGRFHNIYGPFGTWKGGREKAPAAFCRKAITSTDKFEMWGDGLQTRSFTFIDECVEGVLRLTKSDFREPVNIGSDEMVSMNEMAEIVLSFDDKKLPIQHIPGPEGVRGRNSDNTLIKEKLGWAPTMKLKDGLRITYTWIKEQIEKEKVGGADLSVYGTSNVVTTQAPVQLGSLRSADGKE